MLDELVNEYFRNSHPSDGDCVRQMKDKLDAIDRPETDEREMRGWWLFFWGTRVKIYRDCIVRWRSKESVTRWFVRGMQRWDWFDCKSTRNLWNGDLYRLLCETRRIREPWQEDGKMEIVTISRSLCDFTPYSIYPQRALTVLPFLIFVVRLSFLQYLLYWENLNVQTLFKLLYSTCRKSPLSIIENSVIPWKPKWSKRDSRKQQW